MQVKTLRRWNNLLHRDIGYLCVGMTLIYAISGIVLNHFKAGDFQHPDYTDLGPGRSWPNVALRSKNPDFNRYRDYMYGQLRELLTNYGPIGVAWFDACTGQPIADIHAAKLVKMMRGIQPNLIINNRLRIYFGRW